MRAKIFYVAMALVLALSLVAAVVPVRPALADGSAPQMENIMPEGLCAAGGGDTWSVLTDDVTFVFDFHDEEGDLAYLEFLVVFPDESELGGRLLAKPDPLEEAPSGTAALLADMGVTVGYNGVEEMWVVTVDTTATWSDAGPGEWLAGRYDVYLEAGDAEDNKWGNISEPPDYAHYVYYFHSIQTAIDDVLDTRLEVYPGTYEENIVIDESLELVAVGGPNVTFIQGVSESEPVGPVVAIEIGETNVTVDGFDISGGTDGVEIPYVGDGDVVNIVDCNIHDNDYDGIYIGTIEPGGTVNIQGNDIHDNDYDGIYCDHVLGTLNITNGNNIHDKGSPGGDGIHVNWVEVWSGIVIKDNGGEPGWGQGEVNILDNWIHDNENDGIAIGTGPGVWGGLVTIDGNEINDNDYHGIEIGWIGVGSRSPFVMEGEVTVEVMDIPVPGSVNITNNDIVGNGMDGINVDDVHAVYPEGQDPVRASLLIQGNHLLDNHGQYSNIHIENALGEVDIIDNMVAMTPMGGIAEVGIEGGPEDLSGKRVGIYIWNTEGMSPAGDVDIVGNTIVHNKVGILLGRHAIEVEVYSNLIVNNWRGMSIRGDYNIIGAEGKGNIISSNGYFCPVGGGIYLGSGAVGNEIHYNDISLNSLLWHWLTHPEFEALFDGLSYGLYNDNPTVWADATCNWWGDASGPYHPDANPEGTGDWVSDRVYFDPWECSAGPYVDTVAPEVDGTGAAPDMVSLWPGTDWMMMAVEDFILEGVLSELGMGELEAMSDDIDAAFDGIMLPYTTGPFWSWLIVKAADDNGVAMVTVNYSDVLYQLLPEEKIAKIIEDVGEERWEITMYLLERWPMFYDCHEQDVWFTPYFTPGIFIVLGCCLGLDMDFILEIMLQEIQLGRVDIPVTVYDYSGNTNTDATIALDIVDVQRPLAEGCNIRSTWIQLGINKWSEILNLGNLRDTPGHLLRWNPEFQRWEDYREVDGVGYWYYGIEQVELALMEVLDAYYINVEYFDQMGIVMSRDKTAPPARDVYRGWNLISLAPNPFYDWGCCGPCPWGYCDGWIWRPYYCMPAADALISILGPEDDPNLMIVLSPGQVINYYEEYYYEGCYKGGWWKEFCQEPWSASFWDIYYNWEWYEMTIGGGYWAFLEQDDIYAGFSYTPLFMMEWSD